MIERQVLHSIIFNDDNSDYFPLGNKVAFKQYTNLSKTVEDYFSSLLYGENMKICLYSNKKIGAMKGIALKYFNSFQSKKANETEASKQKVKSLHLSKIVSLVTDQYTYQYTSISFYFDLTTITKCELYLKYFQYLLNDRTKGSLHYLLFS